MPGTAFPRQNFLTDIHFDKWVHVGLFGALVFLWKSVLVNRINNALLVLLAGLYGFIVEVGQKELVANRGFDVYDIMADVAGSILGLVIWWQVYKKNKPL